MNINKPKNQCSGQFQTCVPISILARSWKYKENNYFEFKLHYFPTTWHRSFQTMTCQWRGKRWSDKLSQSVKSDSTSLGKEQFFSLLCFNVIVLAGLSHETAMLVIACYWDTHPKNSLLYMGPCPLLQKEDHLKCSGR